ncbi:MAG: GDP-mannose 4,6-dehydratase, partial [Clostridia bacterium]|nr:GDP-mannose 4,6-dehydratase [Clostridia bacterium]
FNPIGADETGTFGESPNGIPNNLMPYIVKVANKELPHLNVFGDDYPTRDGTGVRDYIHVVDLANGHLKALDKLDGVNIYNLGTGNGYSVLELVKAFEEHNGVPVPYKVVPRRPGDIAECFADPSKAYNELGWKAERDVVCMVKSAWNFCKKNYQ